MKLEKGSNKVTGPAGLILGNNFPFYLGFLGVTYLAQMVPDHQEFDPK